MEWIKYTIDTTEEAEDDIAYMLSSIGIIGVEIEDLRPVSAEENGGYFGDVVPEMPEDDHRARISFYLKDASGSGEGSVSADYDPGTGPVHVEEPEGTTEEILERVREGLQEIASYCDIGPGTITESRTKEEDWINSWKEHFHQFTISGVQIVPSWEEAEETDADITLLLDPGTAFGTGQHESTRLAVEGIRRYMKSGCRMLDIGTGSGILGLVALKSGASFVFGTDLDPNVPAALRENLEKNDITPGSFAFCAGNIGDDEEVQRAALAAGEGGPYDLVAANIIAEILAGITPAVPGLLKDGGIYITSGILITHRQLVLDAIAEAGLSLIEEVPMGEWESIIAVKA